MKLLWGLIFAYMWPLMFIFTCWDLFFTFLFSNIDWLMFYKWELRWLIFLYYFFSFIIYFAYPFFFTPFFTLMWIFTKMIIWIQRMLMFLKTFSLAKVTSLNAIFYHAIMIIMIIWAILLTLIITEFTFFLAGMLIFTIMLIIMLETFHTITFTIKHLTNIIAFMILFRT